MTPPALRRATALFLGTLLTTVSQAPAQSVRFTVEPAADGPQIVRTSLPLPPGFLTDGRQLTLRSGTNRILPGVRVLSAHAPGNDGAPRGVRRALVTFPHRFPTTNATTFEAIAEDPAPDAAPAGPPPAFVSVDPNTGILTLNPPGLTAPVTARLLAPDREPPTAPVRREEIESNAQFRWRRFHLADREWPVLIEVREDSGGGITVVAHLQRNQAGDGFAPDFGWELGIPAVPAELVPDTVGSVPDSAAGRTEHAYAGGAGCHVRCGSMRLDHPLAPDHRRGRSELRRDPDGRSTYRYWRCLATERVPMQSTSWRRAEFILSPASRARSAAILEAPHRVTVDTRLWDLLYDLGPDLDLARHPRLQRLRAYHHDAIVRSVAIGDDSGNLTGFQDGRDHGGVAGMNRLNHAPPIFLEAWRTGDARLREVALLWCDNVHDQSIWWGTPATGGTRYNNIRAQGRTPPNDDTTYMWRSNDSVNFCTKGYDAFLLAWEETGDPRMLAALEAQVAYAAAHIHADQGECRNIGDVRDFLRLHRQTGDPRHLEQGLRLFRELRSKLSTGDLFDQGGKPIADNPPFIEEDQAGLRLGYAKPYIVGYALAGLPDLARLRPEEPRLVDVIRATANFLAASQDPAGGWRYPHPHSSRVLFGQAMEHAWQLVQADRHLGPQEAHLDAVERVLQQRIHAWEKTGRILDGLTGWELSTGKAQRPEDLYALYRQPGDRDPSRDYTEGRLGLGSAPPEGLVYFPEVLAFYLAHRPAERLLAAPATNSPLGRILTRLAPGVRDNLPAARDSLAARLNFPLSWTTGTFTNFATWKATARAKVRECLLATPPDAPFAPVVVDEMDRGTHLARKLVVQLTADARVSGLMVLPKGAGPFPAVLLLHDHGARFDIGKEKVIEPWGEPAEKLSSAREWVGRYYGGRFLGDELAKRGYAAFAVDALNWSDRGGAGYEGQQALAANLLHFGASWAGLIAHEDTRAAAFLATRPEVDPRRIAAMGLSMGGYRTWQVAALSDHIAAGVAVGWMSTVKDLMTVGNNQTRGQSAFSMTHPGLFAHLDYPDIASLACPKPMLFHNGERDPLFPVPGVQAAFDKMRSVWDSQGAGDRLETRFWDVPHLFNAAMQDAAFSWLDRALSTSNPSPITPTKPAREGP